MTPKARLSGEERRHSILNAAIPIFAARGFSGTTTKMIAVAADVSEALLYRHFPSKESIYQELHNYICDHQEDLLGYFTASDASTSTLILFSHFLVHHIFLGEGHHPSSGIDRDHMNRLMFHSYLEDGDFARLFIQHTLKLWKPFLNQCIQASIECGDMLNDGVPPVQKVWLLEHVAVGLCIVNLPKQPVADYEASHEDVAKNAVRFALRGMGISEAAIEKYYHPEAYPCLNQLGQDTSNGDETPSGG